MLYCCSCTRGPLGLFSGQTRSVSGRATSKAYSSIVHGKVLIAASTNFVSFRRGRVNPFAKAKFSPYIVI